GWLAQFVFSREVEQFVIGYRIPDKERKSGREFVIVNRVTLTGPRPGRNSLGAIQEKRTRENAGDGAADTVFKAAVFYAVLVVREKLRHVLVGNRPPVCPLGKSRDDLLRAGCLSLHFIGMAGKDPVTAGCRAQPLRVEWSQDLEGTHAIHSILSAARYEHLQL